MEKTEELVFVLKQRQKTVRDVTLAICEFLEKEEIPEAGKSIGESIYRSRKSLHLTKEYAQIYGIIMDLLDKMVSILGEEVVSPEEFRQLLETGMTQAKVALIPPGIDQVLIGDMERTRLKDIRALFLSGLMKDAFRKIRSPVEY